MNKHKQIPAHTIRGNYFDLLDHSLVMELDQVLYADIIILLEFRRCIIYEET